MASLGIADVRIVASAIVLVMAAIEVIDQAYVTLLIPQESMQLQKIPPQEQDQSARVSRSEEDQ